MTRATKWTNIMFVIMFCLQAMAPDFSIKAEASPSQPLPQSLQEPASSISEPPPPMTSSCPQSAALESEDVCMTPACKTLAARMLVLMDHSGLDPCTDFYQYACGGATDDLFHDPEDRQKVTNRLILDHLKDLPPEDPHLGPVKIFYDSCTAAEVDSRNKTFMVSHIKVAFNTVFRAFVPENMAGDSVLIDDSPGDFTKILVEMLKIHFAPFFDLLLDVAEDGTDRFVLKLTPPLLSSPFSKDVAWAVCYWEHLNRTKEALHSLSPSYDVNDEYMKYSACLGRGRGLVARLHQMRRAVEELDLKHHFNHIIHNQGFEGLLIDSLMDTEFLLGDLHYTFPSKPDLRERHLKKKFNNATLSYLEQKFNFHNFKVEWQTLVEELLGHQVDPDSVTVHIYFEDELYTVLKELDYQQPTQLRRILLLLLAERVYTDLVEPAELGLGNPEYCLHVTTHLLGDFVSSLYLRNLPHRQERQQKIEEMIRTSKAAAEAELMNGASVEKDAIEMWLNKLSSMTGEVPNSDPSLYLLESMTETTMTDNFVDNCVILLRRHRSLMYQQYQASPSDPAVLWSHFLRPFSSSGVFLYASNMFLIPYAAMEAPLFIWDVPDHINYAGIGQMIAHELVHGFDATGILYNGKQRQTLGGYSHFKNMSACLTEQYRAPQRQTAASGLRANFTLGSLPLNEVLTDSGAVRLAWDAYEYSVSSQQGKAAPTTHPSIHGQRLPWLDLKPPQLYFLRVAQTHCSATSDIHMLPLMENEHLPPRLRVNLMLRNEPRFTEAFSCPAVPPQCPYVLG